MFVSVASLIVTNAPRWQMHLLHSGGGCEGVGAGGILSTQFFCEPKTVYVGFFKVCVLKKQGERERERMDCVYLKGPYS